MARNVLWQCDQCGGTTHDTTGWIEMHQFTPGRPIYYSFCGHACLSGWISRLVADDSREGQRVAGQPAWSVNR